MPARSTFPEHCASGFPRRRKARCWRRSPGCSTTRLQARSRYVRLADRASRLYAPVVHATALLTVLGWVLMGASWHDAIVTGVAVLIITCPCALGLAIPTVQTVASGAMFRAGVLLNSGDSIERLAEVDQIIFDKTGTLTLPDLEVVNAAGIPDDVFASRRPARACEPSSGRRRGGAGGGREIAACRRRRGARAGRARPCSAEPRCGWEGRRSAARSNWRMTVPSLDPEASIVAFSIGEAKYVFSVRQGLRPDAQAMISALQKRNIQVEILSGDREPAVRAAARALGVSEWRAGVTPADKIARIEDLKRQGLQGDDGRRRSERCALAGGGACLDVADQRRASEPGDRRSGVPRQAAGAGGRGHRFCAQGAAS